MSVIAPTLQAFFTDRLTRQLQASPRTIASYRDTMQLLLRFAQEQTGKAPCSLDWGDLDETLISRSSSISSNSGKTAPGRATSD